MVRVTLRDGAFHEDFGHGNAENVRQKHAAIEKVSLDSMRSSRCGTPLTWNMIVQCQKEAVTDATKRALKSFGRLLG